MRRAGLPRLSPALTPGQRRRRRRLDFEAGTLTLERTRVVVDGQVVDSDGKTENAQRIVVLDPLTVTLLRSHVQMLSRERAEFGPGYDDSGLLFCWEDGRPVHPDTITSRFGKIVESADLPKINLHDYADVSVMPISARSCCSEVVNGRKLSA